MSTKASEPTQPQASESTPPHASKTAKVSAFLSGTALAISLFNATSIYRGEQERAAYDILRYTQAIYAEYAKHRETNPGLNACLNFLQDTKAITDQELFALLQAPPRYSSSGEYQPLDGFKYDRVRHTGLTLCVDDEKVRGTLKRGDLVSQEGNDEVRALAQAIDQKLGLSITILDAALVAYRAPVGDKVMICENFGGYLQTGLHNPHVKLGIMGRFIERASRLQIIRQDNYPNLIAFTADLSEMTKDFTQELNCPWLLQKYPPQTFVKWAFEQISKLL
jgi:hypothetical protein